MTVCGWNARVGVAGGCRVGRAGVVYISVQLVEGRRGTQQYPIHGLGVYHYNLTQHGGHADDIDPAGAAYGPQLQAAGAGALVIDGVEYGDIIDQFIGLESCQPQLQRLGYLVIHRAADGDIAKYHPGAAVDIRR